MNHNGDRNSSKMAGLATTNQWTRCDQSHLKAPSRLGMKPFLLTRSISPVYFKVVEGGHELEPAKTGKLSLIHRVRENFKKADAQHKPALAGGFLKHVVLANAKLHSVLRAPGPHQLRGIRRRIFK